MSVLIHMKMPEHCFVCPYTKDWQNTYVCKITGLPATYDDRARGCPLIEVPEPHGDLVDVDELLKKKWSVLWNGESFYVVNADDLRQMNERIYQIL